MKTVFDGDHGQVRKYCLELYLSVGQFIFIDIHGVLDQLNHSLLKTASPKPYFYQTESVLCSIIYIFVYVYLYILLSVSDSITIHDIAFLYRVVKLTHCMVMTITYCSVIIALHYIVIAA